MQLINEIRFYQVAFLTKSSKTIIFSRQELRHLRIRSFISAIFGGFLYSFQPTTVFICLVALAISGVELTHYNTFVAVSLISSLRVTLAWDISEHPVKLLADFFAALRRVEALLQLQDEGTHSVRKRLNTAFGGEQHRVPHLSSPADVPKQSFHIVKEGSVSQSPRVVLQNVTCSWTNDSAALPTLRNISLSLSTPNLLLVTGPVGCGKSSLLSAILRELPPSQGSVSCEGRIAYVSQKPWIFSGTIQDNILLGKPMMPERYANAIEACELTEDVEKLPSGDLTMIGERGVLLSGGQRARVALARAVYADADVYLLDDPLSAVDAKVGMNIFGRCICGTLSRKARILVTHKRECLRHADEILSMKDGAISHRGTFSDLQKTGLEFEELKEGDADSLVREISISQTERFPEKIMGAMGSPGLEKDEEERMTGSVSRALYAKYFRAGLGSRWIAVLAVFFCSVQGGCSCGILEWRDKMTQELRGTFCTTPSTAGPARDIQLFLLTE